jgi:hypothetical protein
LFHGFKRTTKYQLFTPLAYSVSLDNRQLKSPRFEQS